ncbi:uncharacterized protein LOC136027447 [Artemia franciscana]|uniref:uncharacterized protein LOC136027447 n=1 Tax=Artemia franciscana TaxID=6661 RepID=UPI0032DA4F64
MEKSLCWIDVQPVILCNDVGPGLETVSKIPRYRSYVGGKPLYTYAVKLLEESNFTSKLNDVILVVPKDEWETAHRLNSIHKSSLKLRIFELDKDVGSVEILQKLLEKNLLKCQDIFVLPCDVYGEIDIQRILEEHRMNFATITAVFSEVPATVKTPGQKFNSPQEHHSLGIDPYSKRLLMIDEDSIKGRILLTYPNIDLKHVLSLYVYCIDKRLVQYLSRISHNYMDIEEDLICHLVKEQFKRRDGEVEEGDVQSELLLNDDYASIMEFSSGDWPNKEPGKLAVYAHIATTKCFRVDNVHNFFLANTEVLSPDGVIEAGAQINPKSTIKNSYIGERSKVGLGVRIFNSVIYPDVTIEDGCIITDSLVFEGSTLGSRSNLKEALVKAFQQMPSQCSLTQEVYGEDLESEDELIRGSD